jgi:mevalonate kinase
MIASAPGKIILLGEHSALYGNPVLASSVDLRATVQTQESQDPKISFPEMGLVGTSLSKLSGESAFIYDCIELLKHELAIDFSLDFDITSQIPLASGMGSSAALSAALCASISRTLGLERSYEDIAKMAWNCENIIHKKSSGVDPFTSVYGGLCYYIQGHVEKMDVELPNIVVAHTGVVSHTGGVVASIDSMREAKKLQFQDFVRGSRELVEQGRLALEKRDFDCFGAIMNTNHELLASMGVSSPELEEFVNAAREAGAWGAKLSGAGRGGIMIAACKDPKPVKKALSKLGGKIIDVKLSKKGLE